MLDQAEQRHGVVEGQAEGAGGGLREVEAVLVLRADVEGAVAGLRGTHRHPRAHGDGLGGARGCEIGPLAGFPPIGFNSNGTTWFGI